MAGHAFNDCHGRGLNVIDVGVLPDCHTFIASITVLWAISNVQEKVMVWCQDGIHA
jgi:hypothetical protein